MLDQKQVFDTLAENGVSFFTGVPDPYLSGFCDYALQYFHDCNVIAANEGNAVGIAAGHYFATGEITLVYLGSSGTGSAVSALVSLADSTACSVPMLLLVGCHRQKGQQGDHRQQVQQEEHRQQGEDVSALLEAAQIPYMILEDGGESFKETVQKAAEYCRKAQKPYGLIAPEGIMADTAVKKAPYNDGTCPMGRREAIEAVLDQMPDDTIYVAATEQISRELAFLREKRGEGREHDLLTAGSTEYAASAAFGIALEKPDRNIVVLDGDCEAMAQMGALTMASKYRLPGYMHIILNSGACEAAGGQPSAGHLVDFTQVGQSCGYATVGISVMTKEELAESIGALRGSGRAALIECRIHADPDDMLPFVEYSPAETAASLMEELKKAGTAPSGVQAGAPESRSEDVPLFLRIRKRGVCNCPQCRAKR